MPAALALPEKMHLEPIYNPELGDRDVADKFLEQVGLHVDNMNFMWDEIGYKPLLDRNGQPTAESLTAEEYRSNCLQRIYALEQWQPGSAKYINQRNRIYNFGRVPLRSLKLQYQPNQRSYRKVIFVEMAAEDNNGAFLESMFCIDWGHQKLPDDVRMVIGETCYITDAVERFERMQHEWQQDEQHPDAAAVVAFVAHGQQDLMHMYEWLGPRSGRREVIDRKKAAGDVGAAVLRLSNPQTVLLLDSCSTAAGEENIAREFHERTNLHVIAAAKDITTEAIRFTENRDGIDVTPGFYDPIPQGNTYILRRSPAKHYRPVPSLH